MVNFPIEINDEEQTLDIILRPLIEADIPFIFSTSVQTVTNQKDIKKVNKSWASAAQHALMEKLLAQSTTVVAANPEYPEQVYGYCLGQLSNRLLNFIYVKQPFRAAHVGTRLLTSMFPGDEPIVMSMTTSSIRHLEEKWNLVYDGSRLGK